MKGLLLFLIALGFGFGPIFQKAGGGNYIDFIAPGIISMGILFTSIFFGIEIIWDRQFGFLKETLVAPVSRLSIMIGRTLGGATAATVQGLLVLILSYIVGFRPFSLAMIPVAISIMFLTSILFTALGTAIAAKMTDMHGFQLIINFLIMPMFFLSGALFPINGLPKTIEVIASVNPLTYAVDGLRLTLIGNAHFNLWLDFGVLAGATLLFLVIGSYLFSKIEI